MDQNSPGAENDGGDTMVRVAFSEMMGVIVGSQSSTNSWPQFSNFSVVAKAVTIRFLLQSLFSEANLYTDNDDGFALKEFVALILGTLAIYKSRALSRDETDLFDECSFALASCTSTSKDARLFLAGRSGVVDGQFTYKDVARCAVTSNSSKARVSIGCFFVFCFILHTMLLLTWTLFRRYVAEAPCGNNGLHA
jgi:hypothetical protein